MAKITIGRTLNQSTDSVTAKQGDAGAAAWPVGDANKLVPKQYDHLELTYVGGTDYVQTASYYVGGAPPGGTLVATLTIAYDGSYRITSVTRT